MAELQVSPVSSGSSYNPNTDKDNILYKQQSLVRNYVNYDLYQAGYRAQYGNRLSGSMEVPDMLTKEQFNQAKAAVIWNDNQVKQEQIRQQAILDNLGQALNTANQNTLGYYTQAKTANKQLNSEILGKEISSTPSSDINLYKQAISKATQEALNNPTGDFATGFSNYQKQLNSDQTFNFNPYTYESLKKDPEKEAAIAAQQHSSSIDSTEKYQKATTFEYTPHQRTSGSGTGGSYSSLGDRTRTEGLDSGFKLEELPREQRTSGGGSGGSYSSLGDRARQEQLSIPKERTSGGGTAGSYSSLEERTRQEQLTIPKQRTSGGGGINPPIRTSGGGTGGSYSSLEDRTRQEQLSIPKGRTSGGGGINSIEGALLNNRGQWVDASLKRTSGGGGSNKVDYYDENNQHHYSYADSARRYQEATRYDYHPIQARTSGGGGNNKIDYYDENGRHNYNYLDPQGKYHEVATYEYTPHQRTSGGGTGGSYSNLENRAADEMRQAGATQQEILNTIRPKRTTGGGGVNQLEGYTLDENGKWISNAEAEANRRGQIQTEYYRQQQERIAQRQEQERQQKYIDNPLLLNQTLANLIDSGADAQVNLFEVTILGGKDATEFSNKEGQSIQKNLTFRINNFNAPAKQLQTQDIPYQTGVFKKIVPGSNLTRQLDFTIRLDSSYHIYWYLHRIFAGDAFGNFDLNALKANENDYLCTIQVKALRPKQIEIGNIPSADEEAQWAVSAITSPSQFEVIYSWTFFDCYLISIPQIGYGYENSGAVSGTFSFIFGMMDEGIKEQGIANMTAKTEAFSLLTRDKKLESSD